MFSKQAVGAFKRSISSQNVSKAYAISMLSALVVIVATVFAVRVRAGISVYTAVI